MLDGGRAERRISHGVGLLQGDDDPAGGLLEVERADLLQLGRAGPCAHAHLVGRVALVQLEVQLDCQLLHAHLYTQKHTRVRPWHMQPSIMMPASR